MTPALGGDGGEFVLRLLLAGGYALIVFLLKEAWHEMTLFKREFHATSKDHGERLVAIETALEMMPRRRVSDNQVDDDD